MQPFVIALSDDALNDLDAIEAYIAQNNPIAARKVIVGIFNSLGLISFFPEMGRTSNAIRSARQHLIGKHWIFYNVDKSERTIHVLRVYDTRRDIRGLTWRE